ncbi:Uncharacterised protein [Mycobacteroides abscessus subsp. abscessus]|nr:Uncharacterised protein [Mycobacteroides abscessus subsp. abscessus]
MFSSQVTRSWNIRNSACDSLALTSKIRLTKLPSSSAFSPVSGCTRTTGWCVSKCVAPNSRTYFEPDPALANNSATLAGSTWV